LNHAARYPFRPTSARHIILIPCSECPIIRKTEAIAAALLREQNIVLHVVTQIPNRNVQGITKMTDLLPNSPPRSSVLYKLEVRRCLNVALESNGVVFNKYFLAEGHVASQRESTKLLSTQILAASIQPKTVECQCLPLDDGAKVSCKRIEETV